MNAWFISYTAKTTGHDVKCRVAALAGREETA